jgi:hypothetical protein
MSTESSKTISTDSNEIARVAGHGRDVDGSAPRQVQAEVGMPSAEHGQYGMVREGSKEAQGLREEQIRGVEPTPDNQPEPSPGLQPQPSHVDRPQNPLPGNPPVMPEPTPPETKPHPGI